MKFKVLFLVLVIATISASIGLCSDRGLVEKAKSEVSRSLKDPEATRFRNVRVKKGEKGIVIGEFNAKNGFGAYIGYDKFYYDSKKEQGKRVTTDRALVEAFNGMQKAAAESDKMLGRPADPFVDVREKAGYKKMFVDGW